MLHRLYSNYDDRWIGHSANCTIFILCITADLLGTSYRAYLCNQLSSVQENRASVGKRVGWALRLIFTATWGSHKIVCCVSCKAVQYMWETFSVERTVRLPYFYNVCTCNRKNVPNICEKNPASMVSHKRTISKLIGIFRTCAVKKKKVIVKTKRTQAILALKWTQTLYSQSHTTVLSSRLQSMNQQSMDFLIQNSQIYWMRHILH
jgi:hypothetical protein